MLVPDFAPLEDTLGLAFHDKSLLLQVFVHRSYLHENPDSILPSNERLEFLGDAILGFVVAEYLYQRGPEMSEGDLTSLRSALVRAEALAEFARRLNLGQYLLLSRGEEASGGRDRPATLSRTCEALVGALYLDQGLAATRDVILRLVQPALENVLQQRLDKDDKSRLQELAQGELQHTPVYRTVRTSGPDHAREFTVGVWVGERLVGEGTGRSKQTAEQEAARQALEHWPLLWATERWRALPAAFQEALQIIQERLAAVPLAWAVGGSVASFLQGLTREPHDIDLLSDAAGARQIAAALAEFETAPLAWREEPDIASHLGAFVVAGVPVEVIGDLRMTGRGCTLAVRSWEDTHEVPFGTGRLSVVSLEYQLLANLVRDREERVQRLAVHLREHGYDRVLLERLMTEQNVPADLSAEVWRLLSTEGTESAEGTGVI
jgi:ribonuclease-3